MFIDISLTPLQSDHILNCTATNLEKVPRVYHYRPSRQLMKTTIHGHAVNPTDVLQCVQLKVVPQLPMDCLTMLLRLLCNAINDGG